MGKPEGPRRDRKKLSWTYRNKKKQGKIVKSQNVDDNNVQVQNKKARIIVRNLPFKVTEDDIQNLYAPYGQIEQIELLRRPDGKLVGCGFVQFKRIEDASKAIFNTNKQEFKGRVINSAWAISKSKFISHLEEKSKNIHENNDETAAVQDNEVELEKTVDISPNNNSNEKVSNGKVQRPLKKKITSEERKALKLKKKTKRARIIIRNLSFKVTEEILKMHFEQYGTVENVEILKKEDGTRVGCAFIQFDHVQSAAKAVHYANMQPICERPVIVDFAMPKAKFSANNHSAIVKKEPEDDKSDIRTECAEILDDSRVENEIKILDSNASNKKFKEVDEDDSSDDSDDEENISKQEMKEEDEDETEEEIENDKMDKKNDDEDVNDKSIIGNESERHPRIISHDVNEGKTVFLKNVPFSANNNDLKECMEQFGPVYYALICMDPLTEHSKGTAFVKFKNIEDAEKCLSAGTELRLHDQVLDPHKALDKNDVPDGKRLINQRVKDSRNLYLVKEGVILAGSPAAVDISASDMSKRLQMEQWKSQMLRNLNMFVSRVRLVVHNLPPSVDDAALRTIFKKHSGPKAVIQEARVMRDLRNPDHNNIGKSKGFGFVAFTTHEDALKALRNINNNPNIFSAANRPIVAFSIENRVMVNAKKRRIEKSREHNPLWNGKKKDESNDEKSSEPLVKRFMTQSKKANIKKITSQTGNDEEVKEFAGVTSKPGASTKLRSKLKLKTQELLHKKVLKNEKKKKKIVRKLREQKTDRQASRKEVKPKQGNKKLSQDDSNFNKMVENYRQKLSSTIQTKCKWYDS